ncbi:MAG TPA: dienelactone hydrolase family protein [Acidimicrobiales bacterium]|nr:dienelactone hydrolase family protein [Acidimicrobiales bacterium]
MAEVDDVTLGAGDGAFPGVASAPAGPPSGGVVVVQEAFGLTPHIRNVCGRLADAGYLAVAPALFHRAGAPVLEYSDFEHAMPLLHGLKADEVLADVEAALAYLDAAGLPRRRCAMVGFCMGGSVALVTATRVDVATAVTFYGGGVAEGRFGFPPLAEVAPSLRAPWLGLYGDEDSSIPVEQVERLREQAQRSPVETEVVRYPGAGHGFNCDDRGSYVPDAAADAWARTLGWLGAHVPPE